MKTKIIQILLTFFSRDHIDMLAQKCIAALGTLLTAHGLMTNVLWAKWMGLGIIAVDWVYDFISTHLAKQEETVAPSPLVPAAVKSAVVALLLLTLLTISGTTGCAYLDSDTHQWTGTNGVVHSETHARAYTVFDANNQLTKFRNSNGGPSNVWTSGTTISGLNESSSASNVVAIINAAAGAASSIAK